MSNKTNKYWVENADGDTLTAEQCKGMGTVYFFCSETADEFTLDEAARLSTVHGGAVVRVGS